MSWRYLLAALLVMLCLFGLAAMQYYLLHTQLSVERWRLDREMQQALFQNRQFLQQDSDLLADLERLYQGEPVAQNRLLATLRQTLQRSFTDMEPKPDFTLALYDLTPPKGLILADSTHEAHPEMTGRYHQFLGSRLASACKCRPELEVQVQSLLSYLIARQARLIYPSLIFLVLLLFLLVLFIIWLRRLRQLNQQQNDFINHLTHELNTPIFSSKLLLRLLQEANARNDQQNIEKYTRLLQQENQRLAAQSARILELASWERSRLVLQREMADLHLLIQEEKDSFAERVKQREGHLLCQLEAQPAILYIDPAAWREVIRNLLDNALKYQDDPPAILIQTSIVNHHLVLEIADRGYGIPVADRKRVFRKFYRIAAQKHSGYGLGLTYVYRIVKAHGARIQMLARVGGGSRAVIHIPLPPKN